ncbi:glycosyltransferase family 4 protein [Sulfurovum sp. NBC37-1]|uniref:glycosyltransferase family 4 protein n=1 Tax=Sulfurovum sp. (strain NBC37-1) TaxID=387093 RepID=UPI000158774B|nr:glycosyltransferase family 1 protein [Sulfurovum sp. NBC37-1]BAF71304.1 glycosyl transferase [Sulfurovum sp. NBC37-1]
MKTKKKILVDGLALLSPFTGVAKYTYENAYRMQSRYSDRYEWFYDYGFHSKELIKPNSTKTSENFLKQLKSFIVSNPLLKSFVRNVLSFVSYISSPEYDLYWQPNYIPKKVKAEKVVTTVHDFSFHIQSEWHPKERLKYYQKNFWKKAAVSDWIITGSNFTKKEIMKYMNYPEGRISVIYHAVDHDLYKVYDEHILQTTKEKFELGDHYLLFVGSIEPRKNLLNLLKAYHLLSDEIKKDYPLVLVGFKGWENKEIMYEIEQEKEHIRYLGYLSDAELAHVYNLATLFIYPSLYEGFGIPPLEAMACGTAVIASNAASLPEACGDAAEYIDPVSSHDIAEKIRDILSDSVKRDIMINKGLEHAKLFTWEKAAAEHIKVFEQILGI